MHVLSPGSKATRNSVTLLHTHEHCDFSAQDPFRCFQVSDPARHAEFCGSVSRVVTGCPDGLYGCVHRVVHHGAVVDTFELMSTHQVVWRTEDEHAVAL
jgi:hypothetical protein